MDQKAKSGAPRRETVDIDPKTELVSEDDRDMLLVHLPGFTKEQLRLQLTPSRTLKITGERMVADNKWLLLKREYPVSTECDTRRISARFDDGILYITQPKSALSLLVKEEKGKPGLELTHKAGVTEAQKPATDQKTQQPQKPDHSEIRKANAEDQPRPQQPDQKPPPTYDDDHPRPQQTTSTTDQKMKSMVDRSKQKEGMKSESVGDKGDLEREKGEEEEGNRNGVDEFDGKGKIKEKSLLLQGLESCGFAGPSVVGMWRRPTGKAIGLVVGVFLVLVIGIFYARNWKKALPWNMENES